MKKILLFLVFCVQVSFAQLYKFTITDANEPIIGASIYLTLNGTSAAGATDENGIVQIKLQENVTYKLRVTAVGFETLERDLKTDTSEFKIVLKTSSVQLGEVSVRGKKPLITHEDDKAIVDPEALVQSSTNLMEVIEKTPGLFADNEGNIYLSSTTPAKVYINGREQRMSSSDIATMLRSLPPNAVEKIEIIRTPSASLDASNSGGSINIILRKGYNVLGAGSFSLGMNQGDYGNLFLNGSYNRTIGKTTYFVNGGLNQRKNFEFYNTNRTLTGSDQSIISDSRILSKDQSAVFGYGISHEFSKKININYEGRILGRNSESENGTTTSSFFKKEKAFANDNVIFNDGKSFFLNQNLNAIYKIDSLGSKIVFDVSADFLRPKSNQAYTNFFTEVSSSTSELNGSGSGVNKSVSDFYTVSLDFTYLFKPKIRLESGAKVSIQNFGSDADYVRTEQNVTQPDIFRTNSFDYHNRISAFYAQASKGFGGFSVKAGTRLENTYMNGHQKIPSDTTFKIQRTDLFPFLYLSQKIGKIAGWDMRAFAIARRTIIRPGYSQLNPFRKYIDEFTYEAGNPALRPQFANNYEVNISVDDYPIFAFGQNFIQDIFASVMYQDPLNPQVTFRTFDNLAKNKETYFRATGALPPGGKYFFVAGTQFTMNDYSGLYEGQPVDFKRGTWTIFTYHEYKIDKRSSLTMNGFYRSKGQQQFMELSDFGQLGFTLNRRFLKDKLVVTLNASDVLFTNKFNFRLEQGNILADGRRYSDSRRFGVNLRYNFGNKKRSQGSFNLDVPTGETNN